MREQTPSPEELNTQLEKAQENVDASLEKSVSQDKGERDHATMMVNETTIVKERPDIEKMKLDIIAALDIVKDALGISDFAKASKEVERLQGQLKEIEQQKK